MNCSPRTISWITIGHCLCMAALSLSHGGCQSRPPSSRIVQTLWGVSSANRPFEIGENAYDTQPGRYPNVGIVFALVPKGDMNQSDEEKYVLRSIKQCKHDLEPAYQAGRLRQNMPGTIETAAFKPEYVVIVIDPISQAGDNTQPDHDVTRQTDIKHAIAYLITASELFSIRDAKSILATATRSEQGARFFRNPEPWRDDMLLDYFKSGRNDAAE